MGVSMKFPISTPASASDSASDISSNRLHKLRDCVNRIVTGCELLKSDGDIAVLAGTLGPLDGLKAEALWLLQNVPAEALAGSPGNGDVTLSSGIVGRARDLQSRVKQVQMDVGSNAAATTTEDLLELEFNIYQLSQLIEQIVAPNHAARRPAAPLSVAGTTSSPGAAIPGGSAESKVPRVPVIVVADDDEANRDLLARILRRGRCEILFASDGHEAIELMERTTVDLALLDLVMPGASGFEVLRAIKSGLRARDVPVIMISGVDETEKVVACIETGADDYVLKPFNATLLRTRVRALLERKQLRDWEKEQTEQLKGALQQLESERKTTEKLLLNILPKSVCDELRLRGAVSPTYFEDVTIIFTDFVSFTSSTEKLTADELVALLNEYFSAFDNIVERYGLEKLKTVGDSYIFLSGIPDRTPSHPVDGLLASIEMLEFVKDKQKERPHPGWSMRIGIHTGAVIAGVVGTSKFAFDVWGDAVNFASRMVMSGAANKINVSERAFQRLKDFFVCTPRGLVGIKGDRQAEMYFVEGVLPHLLEGHLSGTPSCFQERYRRYFQREPPSFPSLPNKHALPG
jgi:adenylate cyclase